MYCDTMDVRYALGERDTVRVEVGETVAAGDVIAARPDFSTIIAYATMLRLSAEETKDAIARCEGMDYTAGASLGERRIGFRTRKVAAPFSGIARGLPDSGALAIENKTAEHEIRARYGGTVRAISERAIIVTSAVAQCGYAFADESGDLPPLHIEPALLDGAVTDDGIPPSLRTASVVVAHIAEVAHLTPISRSFPGTLIIGSVSEPVAWALLDRPHESESRRGMGAGIVVLDGIGDALSGARAVAPFQHLHGAQAMLDRFTQTITIIPHGDALREIESDLRPHENVPTQKRDPGHYGLACTVLSPPSIAALSDGERALCVQVGESSEHAVPIPAHNVTAYRLG